ncbi:MAG TPA: hypothetical protein VEB86_10370 [Chryseosolibacter sp.]|nr:hypothetical protein [Chryseosolibacter sp.]
MRKFINSLLPKLAMAIILSVVFIAAPRITRAAGDPVGVFLNGYQINASKDSLEITAKGVMSLSSLVGPYANAEKVRFQIVIRHRLGSGDFTVLTFDERFNDGEEFETIDIEKVLIKATVGDQLLIIPADKNGKFENTKEPFVLRVVGDRC